MTYIVKPKSVIDERATHRAKLISMSEDKKYVRFVFSILDLPSQPIANCSNGSWSSNHVRGSASTYKKGKSIGIWGLISILQRRILLCLIKKIHNIRKEC
jgi:hypothetical protein